MRISDLNRRVTIQRPNAEPDEVGDPGNGWTDIAPPIWAGIKHLSGLATIKADAATSVVKASIRIRYRTDVDSGMRVVYGDATYKITAVLPDEQCREYVDLVCEAIQ